MAKRKPGRPRKVAESFEFPEAVKRKPGRPRKNPVAEAAPPEPVQSLYRYTVKTIKHDGYVDSETVEANDFLVSDKGDLLLFVGTEMVAAFRQWIGITGEKLPDSTPQITLTPGAGPFDTQPAGGMSAFGDGATSVTLSYTNDAQPSPMATVTQVETSANGAQTVTFANGVQLVEADRPE